MKKILHRLVTLIGLVILISGVTACGSSGSSDGDSSSPPPANDVARLEVIDTVEGSGEAAIAGDTISVTYEGYLYDGDAPDFRGTMFDSNVGELPYTFTLGDGDVIAGFEQGLVGMKVDGKRILIIPSRLAYGTKGSGPIPPNTAVVFEVELVDVS